MVAELQNADMKGPDEAEAVENVDEVPEGIMDVEAPAPKKSSHALVLHALQFEKTVLDNLNNNRIPFAYDRLKTEVKITSGATKYLIDAIIETKKVHYLIEAKNIHFDLTYLNTLSQIKTNKTAYESYLRERKLNVAVQPIIIVPEYSNAARHK